MNTDLPAASALVVELARQFAILVRSLDAGWSMAYYRFGASETHFGSRSSYVTPSGVELIGAVRNGPALQVLNRLGKQLLDVLDKPAGVFLLTIESNLDYRIDYEWQNMERWPITLTNGRSGRPE